MKTFLPLFLVVACCTLLASAQPALHWEQGTPLPQPWYYHAAAVCADKIYLAGGNNAEAFAAFTPDQNTWETLPDLPEERAFHCLVALDSSLYVIGGIGSDNGAMKSMDRYDLRTGKWSACTKMHTARSRFAAVVMDGKIYVFGGLDVDPEGSYGNLAFTECYDPVADRWTEKAVMSEERHGLAAIGMDSVIIVTGGYTPDGQTGLTEVYHPESNSWSIQNPLPHARGFLGLAVLDGNVFALGGRVFGETGPVEWLDTERGTWTSLTPWDFRLNRFGCVTYGRKIYVLGGEDAPTQMLIGTLGVELK